MSGLHRAVWPAVLVIAASVAAGGERLGLEELFAYPNIYGTAPRAPTWSPDGTRIAVLWNEAGERFRDLWVVGVDERSLTRLSDLKDLPRPAVEGEQKTPEEAELDLTYDGGVSELAWSPDGRRLAVALRGDIYVVEASGAAPPRPLIVSAARESTIRFSPDGELLSYVRGQNLWTHNLATGETRQLTTLRRNTSVLSYPSSSPIQTYCWSPDGAQIALMIWDTSSLEDIVIPEYVGERVEAVEWKRNYTGTPVFAASVGIVPREGGHIQWVEWGGQPYYNSSEISYNQDILWAPDSSKLLVNWSDADYRTRRILLVDRESLAVDEIYRERQEPYFTHLDALWSPSGDRVVITSERDGHRHLYALPRGGGELTQLTRGPWDVLSFSIPDQGSVIVYESSAAHPLERHLYALPLDGGAPVRMSSGRGTYHAHPSPDGRHVAAVFTQYLTAPELVLVVPGGAGADVRLTRSTRPEFARVHRLEPEYFAVADGPDDVTLHGFMIKPSHFDPGKRYPAVLSCVYADIAKNDWISYDLLDLYMAEEMGYVVVRVDFRASVGYGRDFHYGYHRRMGIVDAAEAVSVADHLRTLPFIDGERIGIWGSSYGGFLTLMTLFTHPGEFHTGVAWKPVTDWRNYTDDYAAQRLGRPLDSPDVYRATSPIHHVAGLDDNLLIVHGMVDDNVLFQDTVQLVQKLLEAGKDFDVMFYPKGDHGLTYWQENRVDLMRRTARYFTQHMGLGPVTP